VSALPDSCLIIFIAALVRLPSRGSERSGAAERARKSSSGLQYQALVPMPNTMPTTRMDGLVGGVLRDPNLW
jgi:hypothetical protein